MNATTERAELVERLRALMAKATAGPWETEQRMSYVAIHGGEIPSGGQQTSAIGHATIAGRRDREKATANAALIVAMRNALPDLLEAPTLTNLGDEGLATYADLAHDLKLAFDALGHINATCFGGHVKRAGDIAREALMQFHLEYDTVLASLPSPEIA